jgi:hypothetical protein
VGEVERGLLMRSVEIKKGELKVFSSEDGCLVVRYDENTGKLRFAFVSSKGRIKAVGEL